MSQSDPLVRLGESTADAVAGVLETYCPGAVTRGAVSVSKQGADLTSNIAYPAVCSDVSYVDGVSGGNVLIIPEAGVRALAAAMMGQDPRAPETEGELTELELSAVGEAMNQMMSAAANATSDVLGLSVEIAPPEIQRVTGADQAQAVLTGAPHLVAADIAFAGIPARLVQLVPNAFIVRMTRGLEEFMPAPEAPAEGESPLAPALRGIPVRLWAELGRTRMRMAECVGLPVGGVVELDRDVDDPIDVYVDGMHFARGRLLVSADDALSLRIDWIAGDPQTTTTTKEMIA